VRGHSVALCGAGERQGRQGAKDAKVMGGVWVRFFPAVTGRAKPGIFGHSRAACGVKKMGWTERRRERAKVGVAVGSIFLGSGRGHLGTFCGALWRAVGSFCGICVG
jgi:hypothetical protein